MHCTCSTCQNACRNKPGWFLPGEAEKAALAAGMTLPEFFRANLAVDWWESSGDEPAIFVLAPALDGETPGEEYPGDPRGQCALFQDGKCSIHATKPAECAWYDHTKGDAEVKENHRSIAEAWKSHQDQIRELLGREPQERVYYGGLFGGLFDGLCGNSYED